MSIKNKRTSVAPSTVEKRLKSKLEEDYDNFLNEDDVEDSEIPEIPDDADTATIPDPTETDDESAEDIQLTPTQEEWMDTEVDELLSANLDATDDLSLDEEVPAGAPAEPITEGDDLMEDGDDLSVEDTAGDIGDDIEDVDADASETLPGDFTAEELNAIIDSPNTIDVLKTELSQNAQEAVPGDVTDDTDDLGMGGDI